MPEAPYAPFRTLDGSHPLRAALPEGCVTYAARRVRDARVAWFNFELARGMGLIPRGHGDRLTEGLRDAILDAFAIRIVNEWDVANRTTIQVDDWKPGRYMATRYLQLQHPGRHGRTSGDGRSVWIGCLEGPGGTWDVSACGTGVTALCPATATTNRFQRTGGRSVSYGCGTASIREGFASAVMSETLHRNGVATERVLAILDLGQGFAINVRAARNLLRPAHFMTWSKRRDAGAVARLARYHAKRSGVAPEDLADAVASDLARAAATFESEYLFVWLDWDGDNILMDGGILDYGSVRQFGLYHRDYRYDDDDRWSTTLPEQWRKSRHIVQNFAQVRDLATKGRAKPLEAYRRDPAVRRFEGELADWRLRLLLRRVGFPRDLAEALISRERGKVERFRAAHRLFEHARSAKGPRRVEDGITRNAIYSTRDLLRELPRRFLEGAAPVPAQAFLDLAASTYASRAERRATPSRARQAARFQKRYFELVQAAAGIARVPARDVLFEVAARSAILNRWARITGDAAVHAAARLARMSRRLGPDSTYALLARFVEEHVTSPEHRTRPSFGSRAPIDLKRVFDAMVADVEHFRYGL
jgi:hypothetical protein